MKKRIYLILAAACVSAFALMAFSMIAQGFLERSSCIREHPQTLSGNLDLLGFAPVLVSGEERYLLMTGPGFSDNMDAENGDFVIAEGFLPTGERTGNEEEYFFHFLVNRIILDGVEYVIENPGPDGPADGMMAGDAGNNTFFYRARRNNIDL